jgi:hypothetical protein
MSIMPRYGQYQATISSSYLLSQKVFFCASSNSQYGSSVSGARAAAAKDLSASPTVLRGVVAANEMDVRQRAVAELETGVLVLIGFFVLTSGTRGRETLARLRMLTMRSWCSTSSCTIWYLGLLLREVSRREAM